MRVDPTSWLLASDEPWTRYRTLVELLDRPEEDPDVGAARADTLAHPQVQALLASAALWPHPAIRRHNDASHPLHALVVLADMGLRMSDPGLAPVIGEALAHQAPDGPLCSLVNLPVAFGGSGADAWTWLACDTPTLLHALLALGLDTHPRLLRAVDHLAALADDNGWRCRAAPDLGKFRGPGAKADPCPIANVLALRALAHFPEHHDSRATRAGVAALLQHWEHREFRPYLFGVGSDYGKLKYPFVWYDILHVADVLSCYAFARQDARLGGIVAAIAAQADDQGRYTAGSMYRAWKGWSFADKKRPSAWLTFITQRILRRMAG